MFERGWRAFLGGLCAVVWMLAIGEARAGGATVGAEPPQLPNSLSGPGTAAAAVSFHAALSEARALAARRDFASCASLLTGTLRAPRRPSEPAALEPLVLGQLGLCEEALGQSVTAFDHLWQARESAPLPARANGHPLFRELDAGLARLESLVARVRLTVQPADAEVLLDGASLGAGLSGRLLTVAPGPHVWQARRPGFEAASVELTARGGDSPDLALTLRSLDAHAGRGASRPPRDFLSEGILDLGALALEPHRPPPLRDPGMMLMIGGLLSIGLTLDAGGGLVIAGDARWGAKQPVGFSLAVEARALFPAKILAIESAYRVDLSQLTAAVVPCLRHRWFAACAPIDAGLLLPGAHALLSTPPSTPPITGTLAAGPRLSFEPLSTGNFALRAFAELRVSLLGDYGYVVDDQAWRYPRVTALVGAGMCFGEWESED